MSWSAITYDLSSGHMIITQRRTNVSEHHMPAVLLHWLHFGRAMRKRVFRHMRTANTQISLRICTV